MTMQQGTFPLKNQPKRYNVDYSEEYATIRSTGMSWQIRLTSGETCGFPFGVNNEMKFESYLRALNWLNQREVSYEVIG